MAKIVDEYIARATLVKLQAVKHCCVSNATTTTFWIVNSNRLFFLSIHFELWMYGIRKRFNCLFLAQHLRKTPIQSANYFKCYYFFFSYPLFSHCPCNVIWISLLCFRSLQRAILFSIWYFSKIDFLSNDKTRNACWWYSQLLSQ